MFANQIFGQLLSNYSRYAANFKMKVIHPVYNAKRYNAKSSKTIQK